MLKIENLTKYYGNLKAVDNISFSVNKGEIFGFIGPNGAGKTTTIKCVLNFINKSDGNIYIDGLDVTNNIESLKEFIGYVPSEINLYKELTVKEMIDLNNSFYKKNCSKKANTLIKKLEIDKKKKIGELSFGNLKKVALVLGLMHDPKLLILDEPTSGLDPLMQETFFEILKDEQSKGTTIVFSTHNLNEVKRICNRVCIIKEGKIVALDDVSKLTQTNYKIITLIGEYKKLKLPIKDIIIKEKTNERIQFIYKKDINELIKFLTTIDIQNILIEEPTIEEIFYHYYK